jgi:hypothetical protein
MTPAERTAALVKARVDQGLPPKRVYGAARTVKRQASNAVYVAPSQNTVATYAEVANPNPSPSVVSGMTQQTGAPPGATAPAPGTNLIRQILSSNQQPVSPSYC